MTCGNDEDTKDLCSKTCNEHREALLELSGGVTADGLAKAVEKWAVEHEENRVSEIVVGLAV